LARCCILSVANFAANFRAFGFLCCVGHIALVRYVTTVEHRARFL
jgi:hypothetical protein